VLHWLAVAAAVLGPASAADEQGRPTLRAGSLSQAVHLDGRLDEPDWQAAPAIEALVMVEPREGAPPTRGTEVKVLAGPGEVVFGIRCLDAEPDGIVSFIKERDGDFDSEDHLVLVLDPFLDGRSGYVFAVNPGGARLDALSTPAARP
jgi:hypothetical protein